MRYILLLLFAVLSLIEAREEKVGEYQINVYGKNNQLLMAKHYHDQWLEKHIDYIDYYDAEGHLKERHDYEQAFRPHGCEIESYVVRIDSYGRDGKPVKKLHYEDRMFEMPQKKNFYETDACRRDYDVALLDYRNRDIHTIEHFKNGKKVRTEYPFVEKFKKMEEQEARAQEAEMKQTAAQRIDKMHQEAGVKHEKEEGFENVWWQLPLYLLFFGAILYFVMKKDDGGDTILVIFKKKK